MSGTTDRSNDGRLDDVFAQVLASIDFSEESVAQKTQETNNCHGDAAGCTVGCKLEKAPTDPDIPPCDDCGKEFSGKLTCGSCHLAFYCSKACQRRDWKNGGHKKACKTMKEECERVARRLVDLMQDPSLSPFERLGQEGELSKLDRTAAYREAQKYGLDEAMRQLFLDDRDQVMNRFRSGSVAFSYTNWIMCTLWRGQRRDGNGAKSPVFNCIDAQRIKQYVLSHPDALDNWFDASLALFLVPYNTTVYRSGIHPEAHGTARDVMAAWIFVCTKKTSMEAILLGSTKTADDQAIVRAKSLAKRIQVVLKAVTKLGQRDRGGKLEGILNQVAAMLAYWTKEFKIEVDFDEELGFRDIQKLMYMKVAWPLAIGTIEKQRTLTMPESQEYMQRYQNR